MNELSTEETGYRNLLMLAEKGARASDILRELGVPSLAIQEEVSEWTLQKITAAKNRKDDATPNPPWAPPPQTQAAPLYPFPDGHYVNRSPGDFPTVNRTAPRPKPKSEALNDPYRAKPPAQQYAQARPRPPAPLSTGSTPTATSNVGHSRTHSGSSPLFIPGQNSFENYNYDPYSSNSYNPYSTQQPFYDENYNYSNPYYSNYGYGSWDPTNTNSGVHFGGTTYYQLPSTIPPQDTQATSTNSPTAPITTPTQPNILAEQVTQHSLIPAVHKYKPETDASRSISPLNKRVPHPAPIKDPTQPPPPVTAHHTQAPVPVQRPEKKQPAVKCEGGTQTTPPKQRPPPKTKVPEVKSSAGTSTESKPPAASPPLRYQHPQTSPSPVKLLSPRAVLSPNKIRPVQSPRRVPGMCWADDTDGMEELHKDLSNEIVDNNNNTSNEDKDRHKVKPRVVERNKSSWEDIGRQRDEWYARRKQIIDSPVRKQPQIQVVSPDQPGPRSMRGRGVQPITENAWSKGNPWTTNRRDHEDNPEQESEHNIDQPDWEDHPIDGEIVPNEEDNTEKQEGNNGNYGRQFGRGAWGRQGRNFSGRGRGHPNGENNQQEDGENRNRRDGRQNRPYQDRGRGRGDRGQQGERAERADRGGEGRSERADRGGAREERGRGRGRGRGKPISESTPTVEDTKQQSDAQPKQKVIQTVPIRADVIKPVQTGFSYASIARTNMTEKGHGEVQHIPQEEVKENDETHNEGDEEQTDAAAVVTEKPVQHRPARNAWNKSLVPTERVENNAPVDSEDNIENKTENETTTTSDEANSNYNNRGRGRGRGRGGRDQAPFERRGYRGNNNTDRNQQYEARDNERRQNRGRQTEQNNENKDETKKPEGNNMALAPGQTWASKLRGNRVSDKPDLKFDESADTTTTTESTDKSVAVVKGAWAKGSPIASTVTGYPSDRDINKPELTGLPRERLAPLGRGAGRIVVDDIKPITTTTTPPQETPPPAEQQQQQQPSPKLTPAPTPVAPKPSPVKEEPKVPHTPHEEAPQTKKDTPDHQNQNQQRPPKQPKPQYQKPAQQPRREKQVTPKEDTKHPRDVDAESHESAPAPPKQKPQKPKPEAPVEPKVEERPKSTTESEIKLEVEEPKVDVHPQTSPKSSPRVEKTRAASPIKPGKVEQQDKDNEVSQERPKPQRKEKEPRQHPQEHVHESVKEEVQVHEEKPADHHVPETREIESPHTVTAKVEHTTEPKPAEVTPELPKPKVTEKEKKNKPKPEPVQEEAEGSEGEQGGDSTKRRRRKRKTKEEATEPAPKETEPEPVVVEEEVEVAQKPVNPKPKKQAQPPPNEGIISKAISLVSNWMWGAPAEPPKAAPKPHKPPTKATKKKGKK